jgi:hypothetical protein
MDSWNIFGAKTNYGHTWIYKTHHDLDSREAINFPLIVFFVINYGDCIQISFFSKLSIRKSRNS